MVRYCEECKQAFTFITNSGGGIIKCPKCKTAKRIDDWPLLFRDDNDNFLIEHIQSDKPLYDELIRLQLEKDKYQELYGKLLRQNSGSILKLEELQDKVRYLQMVIQDLAILVLQYIENPENVDVPNLKKYLNRLGRHGTK